MAVTKPTPSQKIKIGNHILQQQRDKHPNNTLKHQINTLIVHSHITYNTLTISMDLHRPLHQNDQPGINNMTAEHCKICTPANKNMTIVTIIEKW